MDANEWLAIEKLPGGARGLIDELRAELDAVRAEIEKLRALIDELTGEPEFDGIPYLRLALARTRPDQKTVTFTRETLVQAVRQCAAFTEDQ